MGSTTFGVRKELTAAGPSCEMGMPRMVADRVSGSGDPVGSAPAPLGPARMPPRTWAIAERAGAAVAASAEPRAGGPQPKTRADLEAFGARPAARRRAVRAAVAAATASGSPATVMSSTYAVMTRVPACSHLADLDGATYLT